MLFEGSSDSSSVVTDSSGTTRSTWGDCKVHRGYFHEFWSLPAASVSPVSSVYL